MSANSSSSLDPRPPTPSYSLDYVLNEGCFNFTTSKQGIATFYAANIVLLLPLSSFVLGLGVRHWIFQRSLAVLGHSDFYTYNMAVIELIAVAGSAVNLYRIAMELNDLPLVYVIFTTFPWYAQMLFPILVSLEQYLAVVRPITYVRLKQRGGILLRGGSTLLIWLLCCSGFLVVGLMMRLRFFGLLMVLQMALSLIVVAFFSISILCTLVRPRPGEVVSGKARLDRARRRALQKVLIIMAVLCLRFGGNLFSSLVSMEFSTKPSLLCAMHCIATWFNFPSSLLLPLLYLHRHAKLPALRPTPKLG